MPGQYIGETSDLYYKIITMIVSDDRKWTLYYKFLWQS
jgi:hypothetical protein